MSHECAVFIVPGWYLRQRRRPPAGGNRAIISRVKIPALRRQERDNPSSDRRASRETTKGGRYVPPYLRAPISCLPPSFVFLTSAGEGGRVLRSSLVCLSRLRTGLLFLNRSRCATTTTSAFTSVYTLSLILPFAATHLGYSPRIAACEFT